MKTYTHTFGDRLRLLRSEKNMNQAELGEILGELMGTKRVSSSAIGAYERNEREPNFSLLTIMADYFGVSIDFILGRSDERLTVEKFARQETYELEEVFNKFKITFKSEPVSAHQKQRIIDVTTALLWNDKSL